MATAAIGQMMDYRRRANRRSIVVTMVAGHRGGRMSRRRPRDRHASRRGSHRSDHQHQPREHAHCSKATRTRESTQCGDHQGRIGKASRSNNSGRGFKRAKRDTAAFYFARTLTHQAAIETRVGALLAIDFAFMMYTACTRIMSGRLLVGNGVRQCCSTRPTGNEHDQPIAVHGSRNQPGMGTRKCAVPRISVDRNRDDLEGSPAIYYKYS